MSGEYDHGARVNAWLARSAKDLPPEQLIAVFEQGFTAIWRRAYRPLGEVTLTAILDRVLYTAVEQFPMLAVLAVEPTGLRFEALREHASDLDREQLAKAIRFVLVEFLTILGNLTADILSPALHEELRVAHEASPQPQLHKRKNDGGRSS